MNLKKSTNLKNIKLGPYNPLELEKEMDKISEGLLKIETHVIEDDDDIDKDIHNELYKLRKLYLRSELKVNQYMLSGEVQKKQIMPILRRLRLLRKNLQFLDSYSNNILRVKQKQSLDSLTLVSLVFLPLSLITGYFGMNFKAMGSPAMKSGVFSWEGGQNLVFFLFMISIIIILVLVKMGIIYG